MDIPSVKFNGNSAGISVGKIQVSTDGYSVGKRHGDSDRISVGDWGTAVNFVNVLQYRRKNSLCKSVGINLKYF